MRELQENSMSTFSQDKTNAKAAASSVSKDNPTAEEIAAADNAAGQAEVPADDPNKPTEILDESAAETADRHVASTELPVGDLTDPASQDDSALAEDAKEKIVPGAAVGPDPGGIVRNDHGKVAYAPPGSYDAAMNGVQQDAAGHVDSVGTDNSSKSGVRV
jgi:hypothetical protein